jgi:hypothetical protein
MLLSVSYRSPTNLLIKLLPLLVNVLRLEAQKH